VRVDLGGGLALAIALVACGDNRRQPTCGDGVVDVGEECDDANNAPADGCQPTCILSRCGDGVLDPGEECDDTNNAPADGCQPTCILPRCGDGVLDLGEECDDANTANADGCQATCLLPRCGDGVQDQLSGESCDDGNLVAEDGCSSECGREYCGDGIVQSLLGEECDDDMFGLSNDGCSSACLIESIMWSNSTPPELEPRHGHAIAYDNQRARLVMFGGETTTINDDTWEWDGVSWAQLFPTVVPAPRRDHALVYDSLRGVVVLFGGREGTSDPPFLGDTWEWDGMTWTLRTPPVSPPARYRHAMAFDPERGVTVVYGGIVEQADGWGLVRDTWEWDGTNWSQRFSVNVPDYSSTDTMSAGGKPGLVLINGTPGRKTWSWDGIDWTLRSTETFPIDWPTQARPWVVYDTVSDRAVALMYSSYPIGMTLWTWDGSDWLRQSSINSPPYRDSTSFAFDADSQSILMVAGKIGPVSTGSPLMPMDDVWEWSAGAWLERHSGGPARGSAASVFYDPLRGKSVMFGGWSYEEGITSRMWEWDGMSWTLLAPPQAPSPRVIPATAFDEARGRAVLFGGLYMTFDENGVETSRTYLTDTWEWDGTAWEMKTPAVSPPAPYHAVGMAYDRQREEVLLVSAHETWRWNGTTWSNANVYAPTGGTYNASPMLAYDSARDVIVMLGGTSAGQTELSTWEWTGSAWDPKSGVVEARSNMTYDPKRGRVMVIGDDYHLWEWDGQMWNSTFEIPTIYSSLAYDPIRAGFLAFGGRRYGSHLTVRDTWFGKLSSGNPDDSCDGTDADADALLACSDPDCWARCEPLCPPLGACLDGPTCGDGLCSSLEGLALCPADCP
jgi:cysteine-rich repeat protein